MLRKRIIPCLDVKNGKVVKGINFVGLKEVGSPPDLAEKYSNQGADEITFLDIAASLEYRQTTLDIVSETAERVFVPLTVGGGIRSADDMRDALNAGADKVSVNSAALNDPSIISESAERFGRQCVVVAIDARKTGSGWEVLSHGGTRPTGRDAVEWAKTAEDLGAGEILLTSVDADGVKEGYDIPLNSAVADEVGIPVIASGGCGKKEDFYEVFTQTGVTAALAASIFHYGQFTVAEIREYLKDMGVQAR
ncbi:MAG: imidazole glycerol phosphate synthase subunit HisF [Candidatus Methanoplasma sp.]|jgi:cyclase|nr:imidazole glycerol phosphate synthase subunit HisF [Candidatus Methanoplasma sp.]